jgi:hypothetical protein
MAHEMKPMTAREVEEKLAARVAEEFSHHEVMPQGASGWGTADRYVFSKPGTFFHAGEVVLCSYADTLVHGDLPDVLYRGGHYKELTQRLSWLANSSPDYAKEKVRLGGTLIFVPEVGLSYIEEWRTEIAEENGYEKTYRQRLMDGFEAGEGMIRRGDGLEELRQFFYHLWGDAERIGNFGMAIHPDVIWTLGAVKRVWEVVKEHL